MSAPDVVSDNKVVQLKYVLKDESGRELDRAEASDDFVYLHGAEQIVPGLERQLAGKKVGERVQAVVPPAEGYGEKTFEQPKRVPRSAFPKGAPIEVGASFAVDDGHGGHMPVWVVGVQGKEVMLSTQHPLAGVTLRFDVEILSMRDATEEELAHGHAHGAHGHHH